MVQRCCAPASPRAFFGPLWCPQGDRLYSELFNELFQFNLETRRWFPLALRLRKKAKDEPAADRRAADQQLAQDDGNRGAAAPHECTGSSSGFPEVHSTLMHRAAARIQVRLATEPTRIACGTQA